MLKQKYWHRPEDVFSELVFHNFGFAKREVNAANLRVEMHVTARRANFPDPLSATLPLSAPINNACKVAHSLKISLGMPYVISIILPQKIV